LLRKILTAIVVIPLAIILIVFAVANRHAVTVSLDPFASNEPAVSLTLPLFALIFAVLIVGVLIGGAATWLRQGRWRWVARRMEAELRNLRAKIMALEGGQGSSAQDLQQRRREPRAQLRPPAA
jgi:uncharacterized integral membrane protein